MGKVLKNNDTSASFTANHVFDLSKAQICFWHQQSNEKVKRRLFHL